MTQTTPNTGIRIVCHQNYQGQGKVTVIRHNNGKFDAQPIPCGKSSGQPFERRPNFIGLTQEGAVLLLDPATKAIDEVDALPLDAHPAYAYPDHANGRLWFVNDGDEETGNDTLNCPNGGSTVYVIENRNPPKFLKMLCVGRGHHVTAYVDKPHDKKITFVTDLLDGTIHIVGNDPRDKDAFLNVIGKINLCEPEKEKSKSEQIPNNAFPHGMVFSPKTGLVYNLNNGYGTIAVMNPKSLAITNRIELKGCSNLLLHPDGETIVAKGADRKSNSEHVIGKLAVISAAAERVLNIRDIPDIYPSTFRFNPSGTKLYVTTAATGKGTQRDSLKVDKLLTFDAKTLEPLKELQVGVADCGRRPIAFYPRPGGGSFVVVPNPTDGTVSIFNDIDDAHVATVSIGEGQCDEVLFSYWDAGVTGS